MESIKFSIRMEKKENKMKEIKREIEHLKQLKELKVLKVDEIVNLNDFVQYEQVNAFNIDDNGIAFIDYEIWNNISEELKELNDIDLDEGTMNHHKEEINEKMGKKIFYWIDISFLDEWRDKWDFEEEELTREGMKEFKELIDERIKELNNE